MVGAFWRDRNDPPWSMRVAALMMTAAFPVTYLAAPLVTPPFVPAAFGAASFAPPPFDCPAPAPAVAGRAALHAPRGRAPLVSARSVLSDEGELTGRALGIVTSDGRGVAVALPPESYVAPAVGSVTVYTTSLPGRGSEVHAVDLETGCDTLLVASAEIVRSAELQPDGSAVLVHSVTQSDRADMGVARYDLASGTSAVVVPPLPVDSVIAPIFGTELHWALDGTALAVESCGFESCLTRVLDAASGDVVTYEDPPQGEFIALSATHLVTFAPCAGFPCDVLSIDLASGAATVLADDALGGSVTNQGGGVWTLSIQTAAGTQEVAL